MGEDELSFEDAFALAEKIVAMADRARDGHQFCPGAAAVSYITMDDVRYEISVKVAEEQTDDHHRPEPRSLPEG